MFATIKGFREAFAYESITVSNSSKALTASTYSPANLTGLTTTPAQAALLTVETDQVRFTLDGTTPTTTVGHLLNVGDALVLHGPNSIVGFRAICITNDAAVRVTYFR